MQNLFLTGMMGSGKTRVGRILSSKLGWDFIDLDKEIELQEQKSVSEVFLTLGEQYFRKREAEWIQKVVGRRNQVVALGGGALLNPFSKEKILETGLCFYLCVEPRELAERLWSVRETRPSIRHCVTKEEMMASLSFLSKERENIYQQAHEMIEATHLSPEDVAFQIYKKLKNDYE